MIRITNGVEELFEGSIEGAKEYLNNSVKSNVKPPEFPANRTIRHEGFAFFGFKPKKVKHIVFIIAYFISLLLSFFVMIASQNSMNPFSIFFIINVYLFGFFIAFKGIKYLYKNWNKEL